jgi:pimeloyl-ACP methyl ester carboxylesterase
MPAARSKAPVLLITGVGMAATTRLRTAPLLERSFEVVMFEAGRPGVAKPDRVIPRLADDAAGALADAGAKSAHVYGVSFGGLVAQELALRHPQVVRSLVLAATSAGGDAYVPPDDDAQEFIRRRADMPVEEGLWAAVPYNYAVVTRRRGAIRIGEDIMERVRHPVDRAHVRLQSSAAFAHDAAGRLPEVTAPTLVVHGTEDRIVPPDNGRALAELIPRARLEVLDDAAHMLATDAPRADAEVIRYLLELERANGSAKRKPGPRPTQRPAGRTPAPSRARRRTRG